MMKMDQPLQILQHNTITYSMVYIYSPFCGTCHVARKILDTIEVLYEKEMFYELNAPYHQTFLHTLQVESVPCLLIMKGPSVKEKIYAFHSVPFIQNKLQQYDIK
ncbi:thioredoxin family protein [Pontibacillus litoralis]|uniref:Thioredoxin n=1 Tax=Pontibacillus litoralis JSM 072002 TaxID=1385512 RepID=A0A0A5HQ44_9BACI|nr:thioredoxin family protein [Pontibacillus litoralis]KGX85747.1 thioredoxin [Pontibacillus litoralis JSM 072002]